MTPRRTPAAFYLAASLPQAGAWDRHVHHHRTLAVDWGCELIDNTLVATCALYACSRCRHHGLSTSSITVHILAQFHNRKIWTDCSFCAKFMKVWHLIDFFMLNWMRYGYKTRNEQKGSKMAAKSKMAAENDVFIIFVPTLWNLGIL